MFVSSSTDVSLLVNSSLVISWSSFPVSWSSLPGHYPGDRVVLVVPPSAVASLALFSPSERSPANSPGHARIAMSRSGMPWFSIASRHPVSPVCCRSFQCPWPNRSLHGARRPGLRSPPGVPRVPVLISASSCCPLAVVKWKTIACTVGGVAATWRDDSYE